MTLRQLSAIVLVALAAAYAVRSTHFGGNTATASGSDMRRHPLEPPFLVFRSLAGDELGKVTFQGLGPSAPRRVSPLSCIRVHYAGGRGLCTVEENEDGEVAHAAFVFDRVMVPGLRVALPGTPTRVRVAPNGRVGAITTFAANRGPDGEPRMATTSTVFDLQSGAVISDVRGFTIDPDVWPPIDEPYDVSSLVFERDGDRFFATLLTESERYLVAGSLRERRLTIIRPGLANEALSPDGGRLAVKRLIRARGFWQLAVIDLRTWQEHDLPQGPRSIDGQVEWLDDDHVIYHDLEREETALWVLAVDGTTGPYVFVRDAYSGSVQR